MTSYEVPTMRTRLVVSIALLGATNCTNTSNNAPSGPSGPSQPSAAAARSAPAPVAAPPNTMADVPVPSGSRVTATMSNNGDVTAAGQTFTVVLAGRGFDRPTEGGGLDLAFNPNVARIADVTVDGTTWEFFTKKGTIDNVRGTLTDLIFASFAGRSGDFPIATITFTTVAAGSTDLRMTESTTNPFASAGRRLAVALP
jgi:hypothetical protein